MKKNHNNINNNIHVRITLKRVINTDPVRQIMIVPIFEDNMCLLKIEGNKLHMLLISHLWRIQLIKKDTHTQIHNFQKTTSTI